MPVMIFHNGEIRIKEEVLDEKARKAADRQVGLALAKERQKSKALTRLEDKRRDKSIQRKKRRITLSSQGWGREAAHNYRIRSEWANLIATACGERHITDEDGPVWFTNSSYCPLSLSSEPDPFTPVVYRTNETLFSNKRGWYADPKIDVSLVKPHEYYVACVHQDAIADHNNMGRRMFIQVGEAPQVRGVDVRKPT